MATEPNLAEVTRAASFAEDFLREQGPAVIGAIVVLIAGWWIIGWALRGFGAAFQKAGMEDTLRKFLMSLIGVVLKVLLLISVAGMVGIETTSFIAILGAAGLAVGLALQGSLSNFAGGVLILIFRPYRVGDFIEGGGHSGTVRSIEIFYTILTTADNKKIIVPNAALSNGSIVNYSAMDTRRVDIVFGIGYGDDIGKAKALIWDVIDADDRILRDPLPLVVVSSLGDSAVNITTRSWVDSSNYWPVYFDLTEKVKLRFDAEGVSIPFPQRDVHLYQHGGAPATRS